MFENNSGLIAKTKLSKYKKGMCLIETHQYLCYTGNLRITL